MRVLDAAVMAGQKFVIVRRADTTEPLTLDGYFVCEHVAISSSEGQPGCTEQRLQAAAIVMPVLRPM
jgi:hypothetical protein